MYNHKSLENVERILSENPKEALKLIQQNIAETKRYLELNSLEYEQSIHAIKLAMCDMFDFALNNHRLAELLNYIMQDLNSWLLTIKEASASTTCEKNRLLPFLSECSCIVGGQFDRFKTDRRKNIEKSVLEFVKTVFPKPETAEIHYLGIGSGELLADFIILNQLISAGYSIRVSLVDPVYAQESENISNIVLQFTLLVDIAQELNCEFSFQLFPSMQKYITAGEKHPDVITAIDLDNFHTDAFNDVIRAHKMLKNGRMFLYSRDKDYVLTATQSLSPLNAAHCVSRFPLVLKNHVNIASLTERNMFVIYEMILPFLQQLKDTKSVTLTLPHPQEVTNTGFWRGSEYPNFNVSKENLQHFLSLFLPRDLTLTVDYITGYNRFEELLPQFSAHQDFVICYDKTYIQGSATMAEDIALIHDRFPTANVYFHIKTLQSPAERDTTHRYQWIYNYEKHSINPFSNNAEGMKIINEIYDLDPAPAYA